MIRVTLDKASVVSRGQPKRALLSVCAIAAIVMAGPLRAVAEKPADPGEKSEKNEKKEKRKKGKKQARPNKGKETPPPAEAEESPPLPSDVGAQENPRAPVPARAGSPGPRRRREAVATLQPRPAEAFPSPCSAWPASSPSSASPSSRSSRSSRPDRPASRPPHGAAPPSRSQRSHTLTAELASVDLSTQPKPCPM